MSTQLPLCRPLWLVEVDLEHCSVPARVAELTAVKELYLEHNKLCRDIDILSDKDIWVDSMKSRLTLPGIKKKLASDIEKRDTAYENFGQGHPEYNKYRVRVLRLERIIEIWEATWPTEDKFKPSKKQRAILVSHIKTMRDEQLDRLRVKLDAAYSPEAIEAAAAAEIAEGTEHALRRFGSQETLRNFSLTKAQFRPVSRHPDYLTSTNGRH